MRWSFLILFLAVTGFGQDSPRPNVIVIISDDAGYADFSMHGSRNIKTPRIDALAAGGARFTDGYVSASVCSPSRAGLITGRYQQRFGHELNIPPRYSEVNGLSLDEKTIADHFKGAGYRTIALGKWHLGYADKFHPMSRGFTDYHGFLQGARSYWAQQGTRLNRLLRNRDPIPETFDYMTDELGRRAAEYIEATTKKPFFMYLCYNAVHGPMHATAADLEQVEGIDRPRRRSLAAMTHALDRSVGDVLDALDRSGQADRTIVFFVNDNGGATNNASSNGTLRGRKGTPYEGGIRVPFAVRWPGVVAPGTVISSPVTSLDIMPTALVAAGITAPTERPLDGMDLRPTLTGKKPSGPRTLYWRQGKNWAIRRGKWKLLSYSGKQAGLKTERPALFDLDGDRGELTDQAQKESEKAAELQAAWDDWNAEVGEAGSWVSGPRRNRKKGRKPGKGKGQGKEVGLGLGRGKRATNVVLVMADDHGWGDVGFRGHAVLKTPNLDAMAAGGLRFDRFYAGAPVCSPTRASALTGRHPYRCGITNANVGHLPVDAPNLAAILRARGYRTGHFGKWHLGTLTRETRDSNRGGPRGVAHYAPPWDRGFDVCFSSEAKLPTFDPMITPVRMHGGVPKGRKPGTPYGTAFWSGPETRVEGDLSGDTSKLTMDRALAFIDDAAKTERPFFCVVWFHAPHLPIVAGPDDLARYDDSLPLKTRHYYGCITALDRQVGRLRARLRDLGHAENTMLWYTSDNGPERNTAGSTGGLRARKRSLHDGGVRVPGILEWPGRVKAGTTTDAPASTLDYLPTVLSALGLEARTDLDGDDLMPLIRGDAKSRLRPIPFVTRNQASMVAADGRYKIVRTRKGEWELFDMREDAAESRDLSAESPEVRAALVSAYEAWHATLETTGS